MGDCSCVYVDGDDGDGVCLAPEYRKARKEHRCSECGGVILKGQVYERVAMICDTYSLNLTCPDCLEMRSVFFCESFYYGSIWSDLNEHIRCENGAISAECLAKLSPKVRHDVCELVESAWKAEEYRKKYHAKQTQG